jgi:hypothetical protein
MCTASLHLKRALRILLFVVVGSWSFVSLAQSEDAAEEKPTHGKMKFNTDEAPKSSDERPALNFKSGNEKEQLKPSTYDNSSEDEGFKTYLGYPKHRFGINLAYNTIASDWNFNGNSFTFTSNTPVYELNYTFQMTPQISLGASYSHYTLKADDAKVSPTLNVASSSANYDDYAVKGRYCSISSTNFYKQLCYGVDIGNSSYPILAFSTSSLMKMSSVQDITIGLNLTGTTPFSVFVAKGVLGIDYGTGLGNSGTLESKGDYDAFVTAQLDWYVDPNKQHDISIGFDYRYRDAKISGPTSGGLTDTWETKLGVYGGRVGYSYQFP